MEIITLEIKLRNLFESRFPKDKISFNEDYEYPIYFFNDNPVYIDVEFMKYQQKFIYHFSSFNISICFEKFEDLERNFDYLISIRDGRNTNDFHLNSEKDVIDLVNRLETIESQRKCISTYAIVFRIDDNRRFSFCENLLTYCDDKNDISLRFCNLETFEKVYRRFC